MSDNQESQRLEALSVENQLLQEQLLQAEELLKLEAQNSKLREQLARQKLRGKAPKYNFLAQAVSRAPKPIARIILWVSYAAPFFFVSNTIFASGALSQGNSYTSLLSIFKAARLSPQEGNSILEKAITMAAENFTVYQAWMFLILLWLAYATLRWHYNGAPISKDIFYRLFHNPLIPLALFGVCRISLALSWVMQNFYATIQESQKAEINPILISLGIPETIESYYRYTGIVIAKVTLWTLFSILLNKKFQKEVSPHGQAP